MSYLPVAQANAMLDVLLVTSTTYYLALHDADPGLTGANEIGGGSYARQAITFAAASGAIKASADSPTFPSLPAVTLRFASVWTASSGGTYKCAEQIPQLAVAAGQNVTFDIGAVTVTLG